MNIQEGNLHTIQKSPKTWGVTPAESKLQFPCDDLFPEYDSAFFRGMTIKAKPEKIFPWLCQMRLAPYSYDWLDNLGRKSPRKLTAGIEKLEVGQKTMFIFDLVDFRPNEYVTIRFKNEQHCDVYISYWIIPSSSNTCRLLIKMSLLYHTKFWKYFELFFAIGDLIMMQRQLMNFRALAEERFPHSNGFCG